MTYTDKIEVQEHWTRRLMGAWLDSTFSAHTHTITPQPVTMDFDVLYSEPSRNVYIECKEWTTPPMDWKENRIKNSKFDEVVAHASGATDKAIFVIIYTGDSSVYVYDLQAIDKASLNTYWQWQRKTQFDENSPMVRVKMLGLPTNLAKRWDISRWLDIYGKPVII